MEEISLDNKGQDDYLDTCEGKFLRNLMTQKIDSNIYEPRCCAECKYHRPNWDYRSCKFTRCCYGKSVNVFAGKPSDVNVAIA